MTSLLRVAGVSKSLGGLAVLREVDLEIQPGHVVALLGASGSGKTTLLRVIAGFARADQGSVALEGHMVDAAEAYVPAERRQIGYVPQDGSLFPHLTVRGNIGFGLDRAARAGPRIAEMLRLTGLQGLEDRKPHQLSGGQQQRTSLARALAPKPRLVLLDEPFNALDRALRQSVCADVVALLRATDATAILVTHDPQEAFASADRVGVMVQGSITQYDDPVSIYRHPRTAEVARLTGETLFLPGIRHGRMVQTGLGPVVTHAPGADGAVEVFLRPEQVVLTNDAAGVAVTPVASTFRGASRSVDIVVDGRPITLELPGTEHARAGLRVKLTGEALVFA